MNARTIYLDHNASTPLAPEVFAAMRPWLEGPGANPSSAHAPGRAARHAIDKARTQLAAAVGCQDEEIVFTSGGTESDNLAIFGAMTGARPGSRVLVNAAEHSAVLEPARRLESMGFFVDYAPVDREGRVDASALLALVRPETRLVSLMLANNEVGTVQPVAEIAKLLPAGVLLHCDAVQAFGKIPLDFHALGAHFLTLSAHKIHGPRGAGALVAKKGARLGGQVIGGGQERGLRGGTENTAAIVGFGAATTLAHSRLETYGKEIGGLASYFREKLSTSFPRIRYNSPLREALPNTVNVAFPEIDGRSLMIRLDLEGICLSLGSACSSGSIVPSHVLLAMGQSHAQALGALRFSLGWGISRADLDFVVAKLQEILRASQQGG